MYFGTFYISEYRADAELVTAYALSVLREFSDAEAAGNCSAGNGADRVDAELVTAYALTVPREFSDAEAAGNCSAGNGADRADAELVI